MFWTSINSVASSMPDAEPFTYVSSYCNFAHRMIDGKPIEHECRIIPPDALMAERDGDYERASQIMASRAVRMMRHGVKRNA